MKKKQELSYTYYDKSLGRNVTHGNLNIALDNCQFDDNGWPRIVPANRRSKRYFEKAIVQITRGTWNQNFTKKYSKPNIKLAV